MKGRFYERNRFVYPLVFGKLRAAFNADKWGVSNG